MTVNGFQQALGSRTVLGQFPTKDIPHFTNQGHIAIDDSMKRFLEKTDARDKEIVKVTKARGVLGHPIDAAFLGMMSDIDSLDSDESEEDW